MFKFQLTSLSTILIQLHSFCFLHVHLMEHKLKNFHNLKYRIAIKPCKGMAAQEKHGIFS